MTCDFTSFSIVSTVLKSYQDDGRVIMKDHEVSKLRRTTIFDFYSVLHIYIMKFRHGKGA